MLSAIHHKKVKKSVTAASNPVSEWRCGMVAEESSLCPRRFHAARSVTEYKNACSITFRGEQSRWKSAIVFFEAAQSFVEVTLNTCSLSRTKQSQLVAQGRG
jgi:hypothetical protein